MKTERRVWRGILVGCVMLGASVTATSTALQGQRTAIGTYGLTAADQIKVDDKDLFLMVQSGDPATQQALQDEMESFLRSVLVPKQGGILVHIVDSTPRFLDEALGIMQGLSKRPIVLVTASSSRSPAGVEVVFKLFRVDVRREAGQGVEIANVEMLFSDRCAGSDLRSAISAPRLAASLCRNRHLSEESWWSGVRSPTASVGKSICE